MVLLRAQWRRQQPCADPSTTSPRDHDHPPLRSQVFEVVTALDMPNTVNEVHGRDVHASVILGFYEEHDRCAPTFVINARQGEHRDAFAELGGIVDRATLDALEDDVPNRGLIREMPVDWLLLIIARPDVRQ